MLYAWIWKGTRKLACIERTYSLGSHDANVLEVVPIPEQSIGHCFTPGPEREIVGTLDDLVLFSTEERLELVDAETGQAISKTIHAFAGTNEQLGILRDQLVHVLNALGLEPTADFARLNEVAIAAIEDGQIKKAAL